jgi:hypothetical protein
MQVAETTSYKVSHNKASVAYRHFTPKLDGKSALAGRLAPPGENQNQTLGERVCDPLQHRQPESLRIARAVLNFGRYCGS